MAKNNKKFNEFNELMDVTSEQEANGISIIKGRRCLHGLNMDEVDEMNDLEMGVDTYKNFKKKAVEAPKEKVVEEKKKTKLIKEKII